MVMAEPATPIGRIVRLAVVGLVALSVAGGLGAYPTFRAAGSDGLVGLALGSLIVWVAGIIGFVPGCLRLERGSSQAAKAFLAGSVLRFGATVVLALLVVLTDRVSKRPLLLWTAVRHPR